MLKTGLLLGSFFALLTVVLGAFGAHALKEQLSEYGKSIYEKGVFYQMFHSLSILLIAIINQYVEVVTILYLFGVLLLVSFYFQEVFTF